MVGCPLSCLEFQEFQKSERMRAPTPFACAEVARLVEIDYTEFTTKHLLKERST